MLFCNRNILIAALLFSQVFGVPAIAEQVAGATRTDQVLQHDVKRTALIALAQLTKCTPEVSKIIQTEIISQPESGKWQEQWTFDYCEKQVSLPINFVKNQKPDGYMIQIDVKNAKISPNSNH